MSANQCITQKYVIVLLQNRQTTIAGKLLLQANCLLYEANCYCRLHYIYRGGLHNHGVISAILPSFHLHSTMKGKLSKFLFKYSRIIPTLINWSGSTIFLKI